MTDLRAAAQQALEALELIVQWDEADLILLDHHIERARSAIAAMRAALAEPVQEPVAYIHRQGNHYEVSERFLVDDEKARGWTEEPLYTSPPQRKPLSGVAIYGLFVRSGLGAYHQKDFVVQTEYDRCIERFARAVERAHGIG